MIVTFFRLLSKLPLPLLHAAGALLGQAVYLLSPAYRTRLNENIRRAGFESHLQDVIRETGKSILELPFIWFAPSEKVLAKVKTQNWELVQELINKKSGAIFLTPHLGCFEITAQTVAAHTQSTVMYRPPRKAILKPLVEQARARRNLALAPANLAGVRIMLKALKKATFVGLLPDQVPQNGEGVWANFFGKPAYTMTLPAKLHEMSGAPIVLTYAERLPHGAGYQVYFFPLEEAITGSAEEQARIINAAMERLIERCPAQYFWSYNRYKVPQGVAAPAFSKKAQA